MSCILIVPRIVDGVEDSSNQYKANRFDFPGPCHQQASRHHSLTMAPRQRLINHYNSGMRQSFTSPQLGQGINCKYLLWIRNRQISLSRLLRLHFESCSDVVVMVKVGDGVVNNKCCISKIILIHFIMWVVF